MLLYLQDAVLVALRGGLARRFVVRLLMMTSGDDDDDDDDDYYYCYEMIGWFFDSDGFLNASDFMDKDCFRYSNIVHLEFCYIFYLFFFCIYFCGLFF